MPFPTLTITLVFPSHSDNCSLPDLPEWLDSNYVKDDMLPMLYPWNTSELGLDESEKEFESPTTGHYNSDCDVELTDAEVVTLDPHRDEIQPGLRYKMIISFSFLKKKSVTFSFHMVQDLVAHRMTSKKLLSREVKLAKWTSITPSTSTTNAVCGLSFSRSQPDFEGFLWALQFPPS